MSRTRCAAKRKSRGLPIIDYVDFLIAKGRQAMMDGAAVSTAIERIRALRPKALRRNEADCCPGLQVDAAVCPLID